MAKIKELASVALGPKFPKISGEYTNRNKILNYLIDSLTSEKTQVLVDKDDDAKQYIINVLVTSIDKGSNNLVLPLVSPEKFQETSFDILKTIQDNPGLFPLYIPKEFHFERSVSGVTDPRTEGENRIQLAYTMDFADANMTKDELEARVEELETKNTALTLRVTKLATKLQTRKDKSMGKKKENND